MKHAESRCRDNPLLPNHAAFAICSAAQEAAYGALSGQSFVSFHTEMLIGFERRFRHSGQCDLVVAPVPSPLIGPEDSEAYRHVTSAIGLDVHEL
jgi:hypothetical protein